MRTKKTIRRKRQPARIPARSAGEMKVGADMPRCVTCGQPLVRVPRFLGAIRGSDRGFQCQRCFFANSTPSPSQTDVISSERTRWLSEVLSEPGESSPSPPPAAKVEE